MTKAMCTLVEATPQSVKDAVIFKWLRYMKQMYTSRVMAFRKTMMKIGYPDFESQYTYMVSVSTTKASKMKYLT